MGLRMWEPVNFGKRKQHVQSVTGPKEPGVCSGLWAGGMVWGVQVWGSWVGVGKKGEIKLREPLHAVLRCLDITVEAVRCRSRVFS